ncbi:MAG TPA: STAS domain-containing protein [Casimicrobiaceae bacterium]|nr:STAS domain-containing protein [Casimicrobiaceae bacterium]
MNEPASAVADGFRLDSTGERWICGGPITFGNAAAVLDASRALALPSAGIVECDALHPVDSAAVAVLLALKRRAVQENAALTFINITPSLHTLADLYGVEDLLNS